MKRVGKAYSMDLRERVVSAVRDQKIERGEVATLFGIGIATVYRWMKRASAGDSLAPRPRGRKKKLIPDEELGVVRELVLEKPDRTIAELTAAYVERTSRTAGTSTIWRAVARLGMTLKKKSSPRSNASAKTSRRSRRSSSTRSRG
jgi:putative transposase